MSAYIASCKASHLTPHKNWPSIITMQLTPTEYRAQKMEIYQKKCEICENGLKIKQKTLCKRGATFPKCLEIGQFRLAGENDAS